jgi:hypothetical protein
MRENRVINLFRACHIHQLAHLLHQAGCLHPNKLAHIQTKSNASDEACMSYQSTILFPVRSDVLGCAFHELYSSTIVALVQNNMGQLWLVEIHNFAPITSDELRDFLEAGEANRVSQSGSC